MTDRSKRTRRRFLLLTSAAATSVAGCVGDGTAGDESTGDETEASESAGDDGKTASEGDGTETNAGGGGALGPVPAAYETAVALNGDTRDPANVQSKQALKYQSEPNGNQQCSNCRFYIEDKNGDGLGACTLVEGKIEPDAWCVTYAQYRD